MWILIPVLTAFTAFAQSGPTHDLAFWRAIQANQFAVPARESAPALARELSAHLGDTDPAWRDDVAFSTLEQWMSKGILPPDDIRPLMREWSANLKVGIGETGTNAVLRRSFSALTLAAVVARDNTAPFLSKAEFDGLFEATLNYLAAERDLRGFDDTLGWMHSAAHTADLLRGLGRSRHLPLDGQARILNAVSGKLRSATLVFNFGEDERFARALAILLTREDFSLDGFRDWLTIAAPPAPATPTVATLRSAQNMKNMLAKLGVLLARQPTLPTPAAAARDAVLAAVRF